MKYILFNPLSNNKRGEQRVKEIEPLIKEEHKIVNLIDLDLKNFVSTLKEEDELILIGGDGTINNFINKLDGKCPKNKIYFSKAGTGNDFLTDIENKDDFVLLNPYLENLPKVIVNNKTYYFINGVGFGIDGYCCEVADDLKLKSDKEIDYTGIAIKGILFHFKKVNAKVTIDGVTKEYKNVWLSPTMNGRFYGGGMMVAPNQNRLGKDRVVTNMVYKAKTRLGALISFPSIFKGEHVKKTKVVTLQTGKVIEVSFSRPCALQIDGETIRNVSSYRVEVD